MAWTKAGREREAREREAESAAAATRRYNHDNPLYSCLNCGGSSTRNPNDRCGGCGCRNWCT